MPCHMLSFHTIVIGYIGWICSRHGPRKFGVSKLSKLQANLKPQVLGGSTAPSTASAGLGVARDRRRLYYSNPPAEETVTWRRVGAGIKTQRDQMGKWREKLGCEDTLRNSYFKTTSRETQLGILYLAERDFIVSCGFRRPFGLVLH